MQAMMGNLRNQHSQVVKDEENVTAILEKKGGELLADGSINLKTLSTVYFKNCVNGTYTLDHRVSKIMIESCSGCTFILNGKVMTATVEAWHCQNIHLQSNTELKTLQLDMSEGIVATFANKSLYGNTVWQQVEDLTINFEGADSKYNHKSGFAKMLEIHPDSDIKIDQFQTRFIVEEDGLLSERCIRLENGFVSTEREAADWEKRNTLAKERYMENFLKEAGIHLNKAKNPEKKINRNGPCPCDSGKKYKKCCINKKHLSGAHSDNPEKLKKYIDAAK